MNVGFISLGCAKNQVDSEEILSYLKRNGFEIVSNPELADILVINTCAFIESAKIEAIDTILEASTYKKPLIVIGCMAQRYAQQLKEEIPEIDLIIPISDYSKFGEKLNQLLPELVLQGRIDPTKRYYTSKSHEAYLRISEGCNNRCNYCAIPLIRGNFVSIPLETIKQELDSMVKEGIKAITIISQDTTRYGSDIGLTIVDILKEVCKHKEFEFVKLMYLYPDEISEELIDFYKDHKELSPYFDLPLQHSSDKVLKLMNRRGTRQENLDLIKEFKRKVPNSILRTTMMVGFPGEEDEDFEDLLKFIDEIEFDHLGAFTFSREEDTKAYDMPNQVSQKVMDERLKKLMKKQMKISYKLNKQRIGKVYKFMVQEYDEDNMCYFGVSDIYAPDDIDGKLYVYSSKPLKEGDIVNVILNNLCF